MAVFDCGVAAEVLLQVSSRSDEDGHVGVEYLASLAVGGCSLEKCLNFFDFSDKEELLSKGLFQFKKELFSMANAVSWLKGTSLKKATTLHLETLNGRASMVSRSRNYLL